LPGKQKTDNQDEVSDIIAIQKTLQGDKEAFSEIVERYTPLIYSLSYRMLGKSDEAEEAVQEIFLRVYRSLSRFRLSDRFHPWLYTIAINWLRSRKKRRWLRNRHEINSSQEIVSELSLHKHGKDPSEILEKKEGERVAQEAILKLNKKHRAVFILRHIEGLSSAEVSKILKIPEGTVKTHLHRAKQELVKILTEEGWSET